MGLLLQEYKIFYKDKNVLFRLLAIGGFVLYFAQDLNTAFFVRVFELFGLENQVATGISYFTPFLFTLPLLTQRYKKLKVFYLLYGITLLFFAVSMLFHLENIAYYFRAGHGIQRVFLPSGGVFSVYYINLLFDKEDAADLRNAFFLSGLGLFAISCLQYYAASVRGYWLFESRTGELLPLSYSLSFGFNMAFAVNLLLAIFLLYGIKWLLIPVFVGYIMILTDGSRMSTILPLFYLCLYLIYCFLQNREKMKRGVISIILLIIAFVSVFLFTLYQNRQIMEQVASGRSIEEVKSELPRNFEMLSSGDFMDDNHRDKIHALVMDKLKYSLFFGLGAFGDRPVVAPHYYWGHSHGIHYEILSNMGIFLGVPFALLLLNTFWAFYKKRRSFYGEIYFAFVGTAALHLTSLSFWIEPYIFSIIALSLLVLKKEEFWCHALLMKRRIKRSVSR